MNVTDIIVFTHVKQDGDSFALVCYAQVGGNIVAEHRCPIHDATDLRSDVAELSARTFDAAIAVVNRAPDMTINGIKIVSDPSLKPGELLFVNETKKKPKAVPSGAPAYVDVRRPERTLSAAGRQTYERLLRQYTGSDREREIASARDSLRFLAEHPGDHTKRRQELHARLAELGVPVKPGDGGDSSL